MYTFMSGRWNVNRVFEMSLYKVWTLVGFTYIVKDIETTQLRILVRREFMVIWWMHPYQWNIPTTHSILKDLYIISVLKLTIQITTRLINKWINNQNAIIIDLYFSQRNKLNACIFIISSNLMQFAGLIPTKLPILIVYFRTGCIRLVKCRASK